MKDKPKIVFTDLDGTLLNSSSQLSPRNRDMLYQLGEQNILRVVATGRSLFSARRVLTMDFPIDYLVFSTGAGIIDWKKQHILYKKNLTHNEVKECADYFLSRNHNFMLHQEVPDTHYFHYHKGNGAPEDFQMRMDIYHGYWTEFDVEFHSNIRATQFLSMFPNNEFDAVYKEFLAEKPNLSVIKTSSPLTKNSVWLEVFAEGVNKGNTANKLIELLDLKRADVMAVGNDYNDRDILKSFNNSYVVANAPKELRNEFKTVASNDDNGFSEAVEDWLKLTGI